MHLFLLQKNNINMNVLEAAFKTNLEVRPERDWEDLKGRQCQMIKNILDKTFEILTSKRLKVVDKDIERPWGGFFVISGR